MRAARCASSSACISMRVSASRAPNGSSSSSSRGRLTRARASATRCRWPPESTAGQSSARSARPTSASAVGARAARQSAPRAMPTLLEHPLPGQQPRRPGTAAARGSACRSPAWPASQRCRRRRLVEAGDQAQQRALAAAASGRRWRRTARRGPSRSMPSSTCRVAEALGDARRQLDRQPRPVARRARRSDAAGGPAQPVERCSEPSCGVPPLVW